MGSVLDAELESEDTDAAIGMIWAMSYNKHEKVVEWLLGIVGNNRSAHDVRQTAVQVLATTKDGAGELLSLARRGSLPRSMRFTAAHALHAVDWPELAKEARK